MKLNLEKIIKVYGEEYIELINTNIGDVKDNITFLLKIGFNDVEDIFERYPQVFITNNVDFKTPVCYNDNVDWCALKGVLIRTMQD